MGWSCSAVASDVLECWQKACIEQGGNSNTYRDGGKTYFYEVSRTEHRDGAITGSIMRMLPGNMCKRAGTFRIDGDGRIARAPKFLVSAAKPLAARAYVAGWPVSP